MATLDDWVLPPGGAHWQDTGSQDGAHTLLLPGTGLTFSAMNAGLVRDRHACTGAHLVPRATQLAHCHAFMLFPKACASALKLPATACYARLQQWKPPKPSVVDGRPIAEYVPSQKVPAMDSDATCTLWLPSGDLLLARPYGGVDRIPAAMLARSCSEWQAEPMLAQAAPLTSCMTADLAELGHAQASRLQGSCYSCCFCGKGTLALSMQARKAAR